MKSAPIAICASRPRPPAPCAGGGVGAAALGGRRRTLGSRRRTGAGVGAGAWLKSSRDSERKRSGLAKAIAAVWPPPIDSPPMARLSVVLSVRKVFST